MKVSSLLPLIMAGSVFSASAAIVVNDQFIDGDRTDGTDANDVAWYQVSSTNNTLSIVSDNTTGPNEGGNDNSLLVAVGNQGFRGVSGTLPSVLTLSSSGDSIFLQYDFRYVDAPGTNASGLRFGIYNSNGSSATDGANQATDLGYGVRLSIGTGTATVAFSRDTGTDGTGNPGSGSDVTVLTPTGGSGVVNISGTSYFRLGLSITRNVSGGLDLVAFQNGNTIATYTEAAGSVIGAYSFDTISLGTGTSTKDFRIDNVVVDVVPEPSTFAMLVGGFGMLMGWSRRRRA